VCLGKDQEERENLQRVSHRKWQYRNTDEHWEIERERKAGAEEEVWQSHQLRRVTEEPFQPRAQKNIPN